MQYLLISLATFIGWTIHAILVKLYLPYFSDTKTLVFRAIHAVEVFLVIMLVFTIYHKLMNGRESLIMTALVSLGTLVIIDSIVFLSLPSIRGKFDLLHVCVAFAAVVLAVVVSSKLAT